MCQSTSPETVSLTLAPLLASGECSHITVWPKSPVVPSDVTSYTSPVSQLLVGLPESFPSISKLLCF